MASLRDNARRTFGGTRYMLETDPGNTIYRNGNMAGNSTANLAMKVYTANGASSANGAVTFTLPTGFFSSINYVELNCMRDTADPLYGTFCMLRSVTLTTVIGQCFEGKTTPMLLGGIAEGLELATSSLIVMLKVTGV